VGKVMKYQMMEFITEGPFLIKFRTKNMIKKWQVIKNEFLNLLKVVFNILTQE